MKFLKFRNICKHLNKDMKGLYSSKGLKMNLNLIRTINLNTNYRQHRIKGVLNNMRESSQLNLESRKVYYCQINSPFSSTNK